MSDLYCSGYSLSTGVVHYAYDDIDDMRSLRRWLARCLGSPQTEQEHELDPSRPQIFLLPDLQTDRETATFSRPGVTIEFTDTNPGASGGKANASYNVDQLFVITSWGRDRPETMQLARKVWVALEDQARGRVPMWAIDFDLRLARSLRVVPDSLSMQMASADDQGKWNRPLQLRIQAPRVRSITDAPILQSMRVTGATS